MLSYFHVRSCTFLKSFRHSLPFIYDIEVIKNYYNNDWASYGCDWEMLNHKCNDVLSQYWHYTPALWWWKYYFHYHDTYYFLIATGVILTVLNTWEMILYHTSTLWWLLLEVFNLGWMLCFTDKKMVDGFAFEILSDVIKTDLNE